ncbi:MAG: SGNH/GDSL hydrolase family protein [Clostridia bacterium]|nr:SGNH/GDSL hydrolase family protein [Clostridia bacterium]
MTYDTLCTETPCVLSARKSAVPDISSEEMSDEATALNSGNPLFGRLRSMVTEPDRRLTWLFTGDSITANDGNSADAFASYPEIFRNYLISDLHRTGDSVVNTAVSGWKISDISYERSVKSESPDVMLVDIGTNDDFSTDERAAAFTEKLKKLVSDCMNDGIIPVVIASGCFSDNWTDERQKSNFNQRYFDSVRRAAAESGALFVDLYSAYGRDRKYASDWFFCHDTVHPSRGGFLFIAQNVIRDLGLVCRDSAILSTKSDSLYGTEEVCRTDGQSLSYSGFAGGDMKKAAEAFDRGIVMTGGPCALGEGRFVTRRSLPQLLKNNQKNVKTLYCGLEDIVHLLDESDRRRLVIVMPEKTADDSDTYAGREHEILEKIADAADSSGFSLLFVASPADRAFAAAVRETAEERGIPYVDACGYFDSVKNVSPEIYATLTDENGLLSCGGAVEVASLVCYALGIRDISLFSSKTYTEEFDRSVWGKQGENGFEYLYYSKASGQAVPFDFISPDSGNRNAGRYSLKSKSVSLFAGQAVFGVLPQYGVMKKFTVPHDGRVMITVMTKSHSSEESIVLSVTAGGREVYSSVFGTNGGSYRSAAFETDVEKGWEICFTMSSLDGETGYILERITYIE